MIAAALGLACALVVAGCGSPPRYSLEKTRTCLKDGGAAIVPPKSDFVAQSATAGAFRAELKGDNAVTIAFGRTDEEAKQTADGYVRFHAKNVGISDILSLDRNAVLLWKEHPSQRDLAVVNDCLK